MAGTGFKRQLGVVAVLMVLAAPVHAAAQDDYQRGLQAYHRGDVAAAMAALQTAAQAGHAASQSLLGYILDRADFAEQSAALWQQAAAQGDAEAHAGLANLYLTGRGVVKDEKQALQHFSEAASRGHVLAAEVLAAAWLNGRMGLDAAAEPAAALAAVQRAAGMGHLPSTQALAQAHRTGRFGLPLDEAQALSWQARAASLQAQRAGKPAPPRARS